MISYPEFKKETRTKGKPDQDTCLEETKGRVQPYFDIVQGLRERRG